MLLGISPPSTLTVFRLLRVLEARMPLTNFGRGDYSESIQSPSRLLLDMDCVQERPAHL